MPNFNFAKVLLKVTIVDEPRYIFDAKRFRYG